MGKETRYEWSRQSLNQNGKINQQIAFELFLAALAMRKRRAKTPQIKYQLKQGQDN